MASVAANSSGCVFSWRNTVNNALVSFSPFAGGSIDPPENLTGAQRTNNFGLQYELCNQLQWGSSPSVGVAGYYVYRNGQKIGTLNSSTLSYKDHNQKSGLSTAYSITAFNGDGTESSEISITIN